jgi:hypothetical protein
MDGDTRGSRFGAKGLTPNRKKPSPISADYNVIKCAYANMITGHVLERWRSSRKWLVFVALSGGVEI